MRKKSNLSQFTKFSKYLHNSIFNADFSGKCSCRKQGFCYDRNKMVSNIRSSRTECSTRVCPTGVLFYSLGSGAYCCNCILGQFSHLECDSKPSQTPKLAPPSEPKSCDSSRSGSSTCKSMNYNEYTIFNDWRRRDERCKCECCNGVRRAKMVSASENYD